MLARYVVRPVTRALGWPLERLAGTTGRLARENAMRNPARTARTAAALMIGLGLVVFVACSPRGSRTAFRVGRRSARSAATSSMQSSTFLPMPRRSRQGRQAPIPASPSSRRSRATTRASTATAPSDLGDRPEHVREGLEAQVEARVGRDATPRSAASGAVVDSELAKSQQAPRRRARFTLETPLGQERDVHPAGIYNGTTRR